MFQSPFNRAILEPQKCKCEGSCKCGKIKGENKKGKRKKWHILQKQN